MAAVSLLIPEAVMSRGGSKKGGDRTVRLDENVVRLSGRIAKHYEVFINKMLAGLVADRLVRLNQLVAEDIVASRVAKPFAVVMREEFGLPWDDAGGGEDDAPAPTPPPAAKPKPRR